MMPAIERDHDVGDYGPRRLRSDGGVLDAEPRERRMSGSIVDWLPAEHGDQVGWAGFLDMPPKGADLFADRLQPTRDVDGRGRPQMQAHERQGTSLPVRRRHRRKTGTLTRRGGRGRGEVFAVAPQAVLGDA